MNKLLFIPSEWDSNTEHYRYHYNMWKNKSDKFLEVTAPRPTGNLPITGSGVIKFNYKLNYLIVSGTGLLLRGERIILPEKLHEKATEPTHRGTQPSLNGLTRIIENGSHEIGKSVRNFAEKVWGFKTCNATT